MLNLKKWWPMTGPTSGPRPAAGVLPAATRDAELQYWWLLQGDVTFVQPSQPAIQSRQGQ